MKKNVLLFAAVAGLLLSACVKDGDFDNLKGDKFGIVGGDISYALPIGSSTLNAAELLHKWQNTSSIIDTENGILMVDYEKEIAYDLSLSGAHISKSARDQRDRKTIDFDTLFVETMSGEVSIDMFNNFPSVEGLTLEGLKATLTMNLHADVQTNTIIEQYISDPYISELTITMVGADNSREELPIPMAERSFTASQLSSANGVTITVYDNSTEIDNVIAIRPVKMQYSMKVNIPVHVAGSSIEEFISNGGFPAYFNDVVHVNAFNTKTKIKTRFPLRVRCTDLVFQDSIEFDITKFRDDLREASEKIALDSKFYLAVKFTNSIPLSFLINDKIIDHLGLTVRANGHDVHLFQPNFRIDAANIVSTTENNETVYHGQGKKVRHMLVPLTQEDLNAIVDSEYLVISFTLNTASGTPAVSLREIDELITSIYVLVNPSEEKLDELRNSTTVNE